MRPSLQIPCALLLATLIAANPTPDEARRQTEEARRNLQSAELALAVAQKSVVRAARDLEAARARQVVLPRQIDNANQAIANLQDQVAAARKLLPALRAQADQATNDAGAKQAALTLANKRVEIAQAAVVEQKAKLWKEFQTRAEYQGADQKHRAAQVRYDAAKAACVQTLAQTPDFKSAQSAADAKEVSLNVLKTTSTDQQKLTDASTESMKARIVLESMRQSALAADPAASTAQKDLQAANAVLDQLRKDFEKEIAANPDLNALLDRSDAEKAALAKTAADFKTARSTQQKSDAALKQVQNEEAAAKNDLQRVQTTLANLQRSLTDALADIKDAELRLETAKDAQFRAQQLRDQCAKLLQDKQQQEQRLR
jgi:chromosome segregation ATPase